MSEMSRRNEVRKTEGYVTEDGSFFEKEKDAKLHEVELRLRSRLSETFPGIDQERFFGIMLAITNELVEYLNAYQAAHSDTKDKDGSTTGDKEKAEADDGLSVQHRPEEDLASLLQFPEREVEGGTGMGGVRGERRRKGVVKQAPKGT